MKKTIGASLLVFGAFVGALSWAQVAPSTLPPSTVWGRLGISAGPGQAIPFSILSTNLLNGLCTTAGAFPVFGTTGYQCSTVAGSTATLNGGPLTINPTAASLTQGLVINQTGPTTGSQAGTSTNCAGGGQQSFAYSSICVTSEQANITGGNPSYTFGTNIGLVTGGTNSQGQKVALGVELRHNVASAPSSTRDHVAVQAFAVDDVGDGGTNTGAGSNGTVFGAGFLAHATSGATNLTAVVGAEFDAQIETGATAKWRFGVSSVGGGSVRGAGIDAAYEIGATSASAAFLNGIAFSSIHGGAPIATTGTLMGTDGTAFTVANGIDISALTISTAAFKSTGFTVDGSGVVSSPSVIVSGGVPSFLTYKATGINFNSANTDTAVAISLPTGYTRFTVNRVAISHASGTLTTSTFGVFTAAAGAGTAIVAGGTANTVSTASEGTINNTMPNAIAQTTSFLLASVPNIYFRVQTAQGSAATADISVVITPLP